MDISDTRVLHNDLTASSRTNRSAMPYHPSRLVTSPFHYMETSLSLGGEEMWQLEWTPPFPSQLNGAQRQSKSEMFDLLCELRCDKALFDEGVAFDDALLLHLQEVQLLDDVGILLVILSVSVDVGKEPPVIEVIDSILEDGVHCLIAPEATAEPGGEWLHWFVRGIVGCSIQFDDPCLLLSLSSTVEACHSSIIELLDETGKLLHSVIEGDG